MVCDAHLFILQIHMSSFKVGQHGEMVSLFSVWYDVWRLSTGEGPGCHRVSF
jgi:hypothetical protein